MPEPIGFISTSRQPQGIPAFDRWENLQEITLLPQPMVDLTLRECECRGKELVESVFGHMRYLGTRDVEADGFLWTHEYALASNMRRIESLCLSREGAITLARRVRWGPIDKPIFDADDFLKTAAKFCWNAGQLLYKLQDPQALCLFATVENLDGNTLMFNPAPCRAQFIAMCRNQGPVRRKETVPLKSGAGLRDCLERALLRVANEVLNTFRTGLMSGPGWETSPIAYISAEELHEVFERTIAEHA
jgi:hypothetical protein